MTRTTKPVLNNRDTGLGGLLTHLPEHGVVICSDCRFAIQPTAFSSHLQNHHILRSERRRILHQLSLLDLPPPERVGTPASSSHRIQDLPVLTGFKCCAPTCHYACTSIKRMCQHWSQIHGENNSRTIQYRQAKLQTFFRGNKIRYFEVEGPENSQCWTQRESERAAEASGTPSPSSSSEENVTETAVPALDHQALLYMHHYTRHSGLHLNRGNESVEFWLQDIVLEASKHPFLMYGLLCISAVDKARRATERADRRKHLHAAASYYAGAISGYRAAIVRPTSEQSTAIVACSRLLGQYEVVCDLISYEQADRDFTAEDMIAHTVLLRGVTTMLIDLQPILPPESPFRLPEQVKKGLTNIEDRDASTMAASATACIPAHVLNAIITLEETLESAGLLPDSERPMIRDAIRMLTTAVLNVYAAKNDDRDWANWNAVEAWLRSPAVSHDLLLAVQQCRPASLVIFVMWVACLLKRVEARYDWMRGLPHWFCEITIKVADNDGVTKIVNRIAALE
ncbi:hypothetical protein GGR57DRAFT_170682 [Xylariaceae sp. FL1272]|nr:hypothetical protein GGR57DRAFT_170682 [Xylariaceae sp. FL1272]